MLRYQDFVPQIAAPAAFFKAATYESFDAALEAANQWIAENDIRVRNVETVVLPNMWYPTEEGSHDTALHQYGNSLNLWHQFIRVWYEE